MSGFKEYDRYDGLGLAELVKKKDISSVELCEEAIARIEKINLKLNAVILEFRRSALRFTIYRPFWRRGHPVSACGAA